MCAASRRLSCVIFAFAQELLAIALGLSTFDSQIAGRPVVVFSDSVGAEKCTAGGAAKAHDHNRLVHGIWAQAFHSRFSLWIERVPTADNISDAPSRFDYRLLMELGAKWCRPALANLYLSDGNVLM